MLNLFYDYFIDALIYYVYAINYYMLNLQRKQFILCSI